MKRECIHLSGLHKNAFYAIRTRLQFALRLQNGGAMNSTHCTATTLYKRRCNDGFCSSAFHWQHIMKRNKKKGVKMTIETATNRNENAFFCIQCSAHSKNASKKMALQIVHCNATFTELMVWWIHFYQLFPFSYRFFFQMSQMTSGYEIMRGDWSRRRRRRSKKQLSHFSIGDEFTLHLWKQTVKRMFQNEWLMYINIFVICIHVYGALCFV